MTSKPLPSPALLRNLIEYNPTTGKLYWKERTPDLFKTTRGKKLRTAEHSCKQWNQKYVGQEAFTTTAACHGGALVGTLLCRTMLAHRVAFAVYHGRWPQAEIDHINGDRRDNRISNLREASPSDQSRNMPLSRVNKSGRIGVFWITRLSKWGASIQVNGVSRWLGYHDSFDAAVSAREAAEKEHGFHENHGRPAHVYT